MRKQYGLIARQTIVTVLGLSLIPAFSGCAPAGNDGGGDSSNADNSSSTCADKLVDFSRSPDEGRRSAADLLPTLNDPFARIILKSSGGCPMTFRAVMKQMGLSFQGLAVTERAALMQKTLSFDASHPMDPPTDDPLTVDPTKRQPEFGYRLILNGQGNGANGSELFVTPPVGIRIGDPRPPLSVEIISFDESAGVYNFYTVPQDAVKHADDPKAPQNDAMGTDAQWQYHGSSLDFAQRGPALDGESRFCANCHPGGSLNMKELQSPWLHWNATQQTPGHSQLIQQVAGQISVPIQETDGITLEGMVEQGNQNLWNPSRLQAMITGKNKGGVALSPAPTLFDLLKPLFCTVEIQMVGGSSNAVSSEVLVDSGLGVGNAQGFPVSAYRNAIGGSGIGQFMMSDFQQDTGKQDTILPLYFVTRGAFDQDYVDKLQQALGGGPDAQKLIRDVLAVDFTQPILSKQRCDLLQSVKDVPVPNPLTVDAIKAAFLAKLGNDGAAAELRHNLDGNVDHAGMANAFLGQCAMRAQQDPNGFVLDLMKIIQVRREIIKFPFKFDTEFGGGRDMSGNFVSGPEFFKARGCDQPGNNDSCEFIIEHAEALPSAHNQTLTENSRLNQDCHLVP
jgi:hypothetical protein